MKFVPTPMSARLANRIFSERRIGCGQKRNGRIEGNICQHRNKHQSKVQTSEVALTYPLSLFIRYPFAFILSQIPIYPSSFRPYPFEKLILYPWPLSFQISLILLPLSFLGAK